jgi:hypothetical protein
MPRWAKVRLRPGRRPRKAVYNMVKRPRGRPRKPPAAHYTVKIHVVGRVLLVE